jgi:hypothetical protein
LDESRTDDIPQVSQEENSLLTVPYTEDEVRSMVFQMEHYKALGQMASQLSSISLSMMLLSLTCLLYLVADN